MKALRAMENISVLQAPFADEIEEKLSKSLDSIFSCPSPSKQSVEEQLKTGPTHECDLSFESASECVDEMKIAVKQARHILESSIHDKMAVMSSPAVRERLAQGESEPVIDGLLSCKDVAEVRSYLTKACIENASVVEIINRYLKKVVIRLVKIADFRPQTTIIERGHLPVLVQEFQAFLEKQFEGAAEDDDVLPLLKVE